MLKNGNIRLSHAIPSPEELKRYAYCKWHNSTSHATNDCNVFHRQVQSAINERRLVLSEMQIDKAPFPVHTLELNNPKVLIRPDQAEGAKEKNVVIGDPRPMNANDKILAREVVKEKTADGEHTLKITIRAPRLEGGARKLSTRKLVCCSGTTRVFLSDRLDRTAGVRFRLTGPV